MKKTIISLLLCFFIGTLFSFLIYKKYKTNEELISDNRKVKVYFLQVGAYKKYSNVNKVIKDLDYYIVDENNGMYFIYVGITNNINNLNKLNIYFKKKNFNTYIKTKEISNTKFLNKLNKYDSILNDINDYKTIKEITKEVLNTYREECLK